MHVVQFATLEDFANDIDPDFPGPLRMQQVRHQEASLHGGMVQNVAFGVALRAINRRGHILSIFIPAYRTQLLGDQGQKKEAEGWKRVGALEAAVLDALRVLNIDIRPGIVDIGETKLVYGTWSGHPHNGRDDEEAADAQ